MTNDTQVAAAYASPQNIYLLVSANSSNLTGRLESPLFPLFRTESELDKRVSRPGRDS